jgi:hypothetical protein
VRPYFEAYAEEVDGEVYNLLYLPEDGHFNELGHELTYEAVYGWLVEAGVVSGNENSAVGLVKVRS